MASFLSGASGARVHIMRSSMNSLSLFSPPDPVGTVCSKFSFTLGAADAFAFALALLPPLPPRPPL
eukprot:570583-Pyramimonas_sp.AAC.1